jgi:hypothetical protein
MKKKAKLSWALGAMLCSAACNSGGGSPAPAPEVPPGQPACAGAIAGGSWISADTSGSNVVAIEVGTGLCGNAQVGNINTLCASVTVCTPGNDSHCQTIPDILVDTGSDGLRIFSSALTQNLCASLPRVTDAGGNPIAECAQFGTGQDWGPVVLADVQLGGETPVQIPIQVINQGFSYVPSVCSTGDISPQTSGFNGILGVGQFVQDCGAECVTDLNNFGMYWSCAGTSCVSTTMALSKQVSNPVAALAADNNGVLISLPTVPGGSAPSLSGSLILGIGTSGNNSMSGVTVYPANQNGNFITVFNSATYSQSFIDSGSNVYFFRGPASLPVCGANTISPGFFCPATTTPFSATNSGTTGTPSGAVSFNIGNAAALSPPATQFFAIDSIGASAGASGFPDSFDWGLPFFYGRNVFVGIEPDPYWAY